MPILIPHIEFVVASMGSFPLFTLLIIPCLAPFTNPSLFFFSASANIIYAGVT